MARIVRQPVVRGVVQPPEGQRRPQVVPLGGVVVDHVEDHLDARLVQRPDRRLELQHLLAAVARGVAVVRGEETDGVVAPVVAQPVVDQPVVVDELVDRHQLQGRHPELGEVADDRRVRQRPVGAAQLLGEVRMVHGQTLDVGLVQHGVVVLVARRPVVGPVEVRVHHHRAHRVRGGVQVVARVRPAEVVAVHRLVPADPAADGPRVRVQEQLRPVAAPAALGLVRAVHTESVTLARHDAGQVRVADEGVRLAQLHGRFRPVVVQEAQLDASGGLRVDREVGAGAVVRGTQRIRLSRPDLHR